MKAADIDLTKAAKAMGLEKIPILADYPTSGDTESAAGVPLDGSGRIFIDFVKAINTEYHPIHDDVIDVIGWDRSRPYKDFLRWLLAHEMGHLLQVQEFGSAYVERDYKKWVDPLQQRLLGLMFDFDANAYARDQVHKEYRQIPWEADADLTAEQYWHLIEIA